MDPRHAHITKIALSVAGDYGFALAGGYAVSAHGMGRRLSGDVDLFTGWPRRADFAAAVDEVVDELTEHGYEVDVVIRTEAFARLLLISKETSTDEPDKLELSVDWRSHPSVNLDLGPVLHPRVRTPTPTRMTITNSTCRTLITGTAIATTARTARPGPNGMTCRPAAFRAGAWNCRCLLLFEKILLRVNCHGPRAIRLLLGEQFALVQLRHPGDLDPHAK